jgi:dephospho-CoA kinase
VFEGKPIIGIAGGIGSGKSIIAAMFGQMGCWVIDSDELVRQAYLRDEVKQQLRSWWGEQILQPDGRVDYQAVAERVFPDPIQRQRLEHLLHPLVNEARQRLMAQGAYNQQVAAFIWDTPLLFEAGLSTQCDAVVFVEAPRELRLQRLSRQRGWNLEELLRRENLQWPLDKKREISDYVVVNTADAEFARGQVVQVLSRVLARPSP